MNEYAKVLVGRRYHTLLENQYLGFFARMIGVIESPRPPLDRAHRFVLRTLIGTVGTLSWTNMGRF
jgi:hypothetical protein